MSRIALVGMPADGVSCVGVSAGREGGSLANVGDCRARDLAPEDTPRGARFAAHHHRRRSAPLRCLPPRSRGASRLRLRQPRLFDLLTCRPPSCGAFTCSSMLLSARASPSRPPRAPRSRGLRCRHRARLEAAGASQKILADTRMEMLFRSARGVLRVDSKTLRTAIRTAADRASSLSPPCRPLSTSWAPPLYGRGHRARRQLRGVCRARALELASVLIHVIVSALLGYLRALQRQLDLAVLSVGNARKACCGRQAGVSLRGSGDFRARGDSSPCAASGIRLCELHPFISCRVVLE